MLFHWSLVGGTVHGMLFSLVTCWRDGSYSLFAGRISEKHYSVADKSLAHQEGNKLQRQKVLIFIYPIYNHNWSNTCLLTPWSRVLLEKLTGSAASQEIPRIFGTRSFVTVPTSARHLSLS